MRDPDLLAALEEVLALESSSLARYLIEVARPAVVDSADEKTLPCLQDLYHEVERNRVRLAELLAGEEVRAVEAGWPLSYSSYNFLQPRYLLPHVIGDTRRRLEEIERAVVPVTPPSWPEAREAVDSLLAGRRRLLERLEETARQVPQESPPAPVLKGTSASRW